MKVGFGLWGVSPLLYPAICTKAEELGFEFVWHWDHLVWPATMPPQYPYTADGVPPATVETDAFDPWVALATIASVTTKLTLGTNVYILPLRHPIVTARAVSTLDFVSNGRVLVGCGVGWLEDEFRIMGEDFHTRGKRTDEIVAILKQLWSGEVKGWDGQHYQFEPVSFRPLPVRKPHPPLLFGGDTPAALRRAARLGDGWLAIGKGGESEFPERVAFLRKERAACGRADEPFEITVGAGPNPTADSIRRLQAAGASRVTVAPWPPPEKGSPTVEHAVAGMEAFAERVLRHLG